jgi:hypothetical protein
MEKHITGNLNAESIRSLAFAVLASHALGVLPNEVSAADLIDELIQFDPSLEGNETTESPLVEMRRRIEKLKLSKS